MDINLSALEASRGRSTNDNMHKRIMPTDNKNMKELGKTISDDIRSSTTMNSIPDMARYLPIRQEKYKDSKNRSTKLYILQGIAQFVLPIIYTVFIITYFSVVFSN